MDQALNLNNLIALFLSEAIRTRRTSLSRAAEISERVICALKNLTSEEKVLGMLTEIEKDFGEVSSLKEALHFGYDVTGIKAYEPEIKEFASRMVAKDLSASDNFLQDAANSQMTIQQLCVKYPDFCRFLLSTSDKAGIFSELSTQNLQTQKA